MRIDVKDVNPAFLEIVMNPEQPVFLDDNPDWGCFCRIWTFPVNHRDHSI